MKTKNTLNVRKVNSKEYVSLVWLSKYDKEGCNRTE